ncbi:Hint domain-containing protein [Pseudaestuariivita atlantica]|uniref:Hint domain-containing protein n=1 Tax=Pseudaestuariivita atlantica TaxID=1317121 RepID=UPI0009E29F09|nr:Hint domain-containing protein [Pseudaestuariivita atlantica]
MGLYLNELSVGIDYGVMENGQDVFEPGLSSLETTSHYFHTDVIDISSGTSLTITGDYEYFPNASNPEPDAITLTIFPAYSYLDFTDEGDGTFTLDINLNEMRDALASGGTLDTNVLLTARATGEGVVDVGDLLFINFEMCFAAGTMIAAPGKSRPVETLAIGDRILNAEGHEVEVLWLGRNTCHKIRSGARMQPVRIRKGALGGGLPYADLTVTADHGMVIDGYVINASALVNGHSIDFVPMAELPEFVTYYHVETAAHDVILANGAPSETFIDYLGRAAFDNHDEYLALYGAERIIPELPQPRISAARHVPEHIRMRLGCAAAMEFPGQVA